MNVPADSPFGRAARPEQARPAWHARNELTGVRAGQTRPSLRLGTRHPADCRAGVVLFVVMIVIVMLSLAGLSFVITMSTENKAVHVSGDELQIEQVAASGHLIDPVTRHLELADGLTSPEMEIRLDARMTHLFLAQRLDPILFGDRPEEALVALNLLELLGEKAQGPMPDMVRARLRRALVHLMAVQRSDGGWGWCRGAPSVSLLVMFSSSTSISLISTSSKLTVRVRKSSPSETTTVK